MQIKPKKLFKTHNPYKVRRRKENKLYSDAVLTDADKMSSLYVQYAQLPNPSECRKFLLNANRLYGAKLPQWAKQELETLRKFKQDENKQYAESHKETIEKNNAKWNGYFKELRNEEENKTISPQDKEKLKRQRGSIKNSLQRKRTRENFGLRNNSAFKANQPNDDDQNYRTRRILFPIHAPIYVLSNGLSNDPNQNSEISNDLSNVTEPNSEIPNGLSIVPNPNYGLSEHSAFHQNNKANHNTDDIKKQVNIEKK